ncbi:phage holin family protein [Actinomadura rugatobispora]|uniref:Phage holin family protein n=1 Tax=Actinomadura rugatobispora TaxID=1994 RepID=A0ABW0ZPK1_9ACTN|nr:phage holin family protein [Actinomadura rugatobispora]
MSTVRPQESGERTAGDTVYTAPAQRVPEDAPVRAARGGEGVGELVSRASQQVSELVRAELRLAVMELKDKGKHAGTGAGLYGGAGLVALYGVGALIAAVIAALALVLPVWASALIVGAVLLVIAAVLAAMGRSQTKRAVPPKPEQAMDSARRDVAEIKERAHR